MGEWMEKKNLDLFRTMPYIKYVIFYYVCHSSILLVKTCQTKRPAQIATTRPPTTSSFSYVKVCAPNARRPAPSTTQHRELWHTNIISNRTTAMVHFNKAKINNIALGRQQSGCISVSHSQQKHKFIYIFNTYLYIVNEWMCSNIVVL